MDVDSLGLTCKILHTYDHALEMVALHVRIYDLIFFSLQFLEEYDCETVGAFLTFFFFWFRLESVEIDTCMLFFFCPFLLAGDPQTAISHLGNVVLFVQYALVKFKVCKYYNEPQKYAFSIKLL